MAIKCLTVDENEQEKNKTNIIAFTEVWAVLLCRNLIFGDRIYDRMDSHSQISFTILSMKSENKYFLILPTLPRVE